MKKRIENFISQAFEPLFFIGLVVSVFLKWCFSSNFRNCAHEVLSKTGRSVWVILRVSSKLGSNKMPYLTPAFIILPALVGGLLTGTAIYVFLGALLGMLLPIIILVLSPVPSSLLD
jgi:hypothetical protein